MYIFLQLFDSNIENFKNLFNLPVHVIEKRQFKEMNKIFSRFSINWDLMK